MIIKYEPTLGYDDEDSYVTMEPCKDGEWVKWEDIKHRIEPPSTEEMIADIKQYREAIIGECNVINNDLKMILSKMEGTSAESLKTSFQSITKFIQNLVGMIKGIDQKFKELETSLQQSAAKLATLKK